MGTEKNSQSKISAAKDFSFIIPVPPESINETVALGTHYSDVRLVKRKWQHITISHLNAQRLDNPAPYAGFPCEKKVKATFTFYFKFERARDEDNYSLSAKGILDGLVEMGVLYADSSSFVTFGGVILEVDYERPRCEVKIEMLEEDIDFKKWDKYDKTDPNGDEAIKMLDGLGDN